MKSPFEATETLSLFEDGAEYILRRVESGGGAVHELRLLPANVLQLPRVAHKQIALILQKLTTQALKEQGVSPIPACPVTQVRVGTSLHNDVLLRVEDEFGGEFSFSLSRNQAVALAGLLAKTVQNADGGKPQSLQ